MQQKHRLQVLLARGTERFGRTGWVGLALCLMAAMWFTQAWRGHQANLQAQPVEQEREPTATSVSTSNAAGHRVTLAHPDEQALLLTQIQQVAVSQGLAWTSADYKLVPAGESTPMALEVRCTLKGAYPRLRATLAQWLQQVPGLAIRDLGMSRPNSDSADVEAKLQLVVFMRSHSPEIRP